MHNQNRLILKGSICWALGALMSWGGPLQAVEKKHEEKTNHRARLEVKIQNIRAAKGFIFCSLFAESGAESFPSQAEKALVSQTVAVSPQTQGDVKCVFPSLLQGRYAVAVMHDENSNNRMDTNFFGLPVEGWGVSNNVGPGLMGPPDFSDANIEVLENKNHDIVIELRHGLI